MEIKEKLWLLGSNRRADDPVVELQLAFSTPEQDALGESGENLKTILCDVLDELAIVDTGNLMDFSWDSTDHPGSFCQMYARLVIVLQSASGHRVEVFGVQKDSAGQGYWIWFEYEHDSVAAAALSLAFFLLGSIEEKLQLPELEDAPGTEEASWESFQLFAKSRVLTREAEAIFNAARALDVPCVKLERSPYSAAKGASRIRLNGLLKLGHGPFQQVVDGSLCVSRDARLLPLLNDHPARRATLSKLGFVLAVTDPEAGNCALTKRALRSAERIGYPVSLFVTSTGGKRFSYQGISGPDDLRNKLDQARQHGTQVELEATVPGEDWRLIMVGSRILAMLGRGKAHPVENLNQGTRQRLEELARHLGSGVLGIHVRASDISRELNPANGAVLDFDLAPRLDEWLADQKELLEQVCKEFVCHLFPPGSQSKIPIVTVTGTNGKTTSCRMLEAILGAVGHGTGMVISGANRIHGQLEEVPKGAWQGRQFRIFDNPQVNLGIFEEFLGTILGTGFLYQYSDVAICTNVTDDHLGRLGIHDLDTLAAIKALVIRRASKAAVLNADNDYSLGMMAVTPAEQLGLVSLEKPANTLLEMLDRPGLVCALENIDGQAWLVISGQHESTPLIRVNDIPATFEGKATHNIANAMQAALAALFLGTDLRVIEKALAGFQSNFATSEGRLNFMTGLPFQFLLDYAHNLDGFRVLCNFTSQLEIAGRRIVLLAFTGDRQDQAVKTAVSFLAPYFDYFICTNYLGLRGREPEEIPRLISKYLLEAGVDPKQLVIEPERERAMLAATDSAQSGDLLVFLSSSNEFRAIWDRMESFRDQLSAGHPAS